MIDPFLALLGSYFLAVVAIGAALFVAFGNSVLRISIALFVELLTLCAIFLTLGAEYLGIFALLLAVLAPILVMAFSSVILGNLQEKTLGNTGTASSKVLRYLGFLSGMGIGVSVALVIMELPIVRNNDATKVVSASTIQLGQSLLGEHVIVFELMAIMTLSLAIGAGILLRRAR